MTTPANSAHRPVQLLSRELADQIAAGEVVERPSSVVKELVENALDAGARTIRVEIENGGLDRIVVVDDGAGMDSASALLAIERHATSKLASFDELFRLGTFGFRGEALPSIASVSRFKLTTRRPEALSGTEISLLSGQKPFTREVGAPPGTAIEVVELFYNVPARRKFIKSAATEAGHIADTLLDLALARADVSISLLRDGRPVRQYLREATRAGRARDALSRSLNDGTRLVTEFVHLDGERPGVQVEALLSPPERARTGANGLHLLVNGRAVRDRALARSVAMAYGSVLDPGRYPLGVVYVDVALEEVDVNVHPQKAEVRFARGRELYDDVSRVLAAGLAETFRRAGSVQVEDEPPTPVTPTRGPVNRGLAELSEAMGRAIHPFGGVPLTRAKSDTPHEADPWGIGPNALPMEPPRREPDDPRDYTLPSAQYMVFPARGEPSPAAQATAAAAAADAEEAEKETTLVSTRSPQTVETSKGPYSQLRFLSQVRATYLVCEGTDGIYVLDQHAAAERVNFHKLRTSYAKRSIHRQQLLIAEVLEVSSAESVLVDELHDVFLGFGVEANAIGDGRVAVMAVPAILRKARPAAILRDLLDEVERTGERAFSDATDLVLATMACHGSVRAGDPLHADECIALLRALDDVDFAGYCPHGRPIVTSMSYSELEKRVGRR